MIDRVPVASSNIVSAGYDRATQTLEVEFPGPRVYRIEGFTEDRWRDFMGSDSKGSFYARVIRPSYTAVLVDPEAEPEVEVEEPESDPEPQVEEASYRCPHCHEPCEPMAHLDRATNTYTCPRAG